MGGVQLAHGEVVKRVYRLGRAQRAWGWVEGVLVVTDTRVLYRAEASNPLNKSTLNREIHLKDIRGVGLSTRRGLGAAACAAWLVGTFVGLLAALFFGGLLNAVTSLGSATSGGSVGWTFLLLLLWLVLAVAILIARARASVVALAIFSAEGDSSPISVTGVVGTRGGDGFFAAIGMPLIILMQRMGILEAGAAAESADIDSVRSVYAELGAVILDLQSRGTLGAD
jgi:hypothetical protein